MLPRKYLHDGLGFSSHKTVTSCGNFQSRSHIRGKNTISATFELAVYAAALVAGSPLHVWCSPLVANRKLDQHRLSKEYAPTNHGLVPEKTFVTHTKHDAELLQAQPQKEQVQAIWGGVEPH